MIMRVVSLDLQSMSGPGASFHFLSYSMPTLSLFPSLCSVPLRGYLRRVYLLTSPASLLRFAFHCTFALVQLTSPHPTPPTPKMNDKLDKLWPLSSHAVDSPSPPLILSIGNVVVRRLLSTYYAALQERSTSSSPSIISLHHHLPITCCLTLSGGSSLLGRQTDLCLTSS